MSLRDEFINSALYSQMVKDPYDGRRGSDGKFMWSRLEYAYLGFEEATERATKIIRLGQDEVCALYGKPPGLCDFTKTDEV